MCWNMLICQICFLNERRKPMEVVKINKKTYKCLWVANHSWKFGKFREIRKRLGLKVQRCCFNCEHKFSDDEDIYLAMFKGTLNQFLCKECMETAKNDLEKEKTGEKA